MSHDTAARKAFGVTLATIVRRIEKTRLLATPADIESGARWYDEAGDLASSLATDEITREHVAAIISHLSPRTTWARNVAGTVAMVTDGPEAARAIGCLGANVARATIALGSDAPLDTFGGPKTRRFAANIAGDRESVTVDVWACRVADLDENRLSIVGAYDAVEHAYRTVARRHGVDPATMQATTWIVARNGRAA